MVIAQPCADVAELADALDSGSSSRKGVEVQVLSSAPIKSINYRDSPQILVAFVSVCEFGAVRTLQLTRRQDDFGYRFWKSLELLRLQVTSVMRIRSRQLR